MPDAVSRLWDREGGPGLENRVSQNKAPENASPTETALAEAALVSGGWQDYMGQGDWGSLLPQGQSALFEAEEKLRLSPSSLSTYMRCPRQFYYGSLLGLRVESSPEAAMGTMIHSIMERFNRFVSDTPEAVHTLETLLDVLAAFFDTLETEPDTDGGPMPYGIRPEDRAPLKPLSALGRLELYQRIQLAFVDMAAKGYFRQPVAVVRAEEKFVYNDGQSDNALGQVAIPGLERCELAARIDALIQRPDGSWDIVDYKFYGPNKFDLKDPTSGKLEEQLYYALTPLPQGELSHTQRFKSTDAKPRDPQLPFYFLLTQYDPTLANQVGGASLQVIRPPFPDNPNQGAIPIRLMADRLLEGLPQWVSDMAQYVVQPVLTSETLEAVGGLPCKTCGFAAVCDVRPDADAMEAMGDAAGGEHVE